MLYVHKTDTKRYHRYEPAPDAGILGDLYIPLETFEALGETPRALEITIQPSQGDKEDAQAA